MKLNLFAIGATALCFFQQAIATPVGSTNVADVVQINDHTTSASNENFISIKRDGLLNGVEELLHELLGTVGLTDNDLLGLELGGLGKTIHDLLEILLGNNDQLGHLLDPLLGNLRGVYCSNGIDIGGDSDIDDEITKREDSENEKKCVAVPNYKPDAGLLGTILNEVKSLLDGGILGLGGDGLLGGKDGLIPTVVKTVGCLLKSLTGGNGLTGGDGLLQHKRALIRRKLIQAVAEAKK